MPISSYEIRVCKSCGLRYPLVDGHPFGVRCPVCVGDTYVALSQQLVTESQAPDEGKDERHLHPICLANRAFPDTVRQDRCGAVQVRKNLAVLLDNIRSAWNVGSILRSADGFGFTHAFLCGITPTADNEAVAKTSLGAENSVPSSYHKDAVRLVKGLKAEGWKVYAMEENARAAEISRAAGMTYTETRGVLIVGNEVTGVDPELLDLCDRIFYIPMRGEKKSFNVAIAFGIAAYALNVQKAEG